MIGGASARTASRARAVSNPVRTRSEVSDGSAQRQKSNERQVPIVGLERGVAPPRAPGLARDGLLRQEARGGDHREAAVRELLLLHQAELGRVLRLERERVEAEVVRVVARLERRLGLRLAGIVKLGEAKVDAVG